jgi:hypothetical protein
MGDKMKTPDEEVADRIIEQIKEKKLLSEEGIKKIEKGLASGKLTSEDWKLTFETERKGEEGGNASKSNQHNYDWIQRSDLPR